VRIVVAAAAAVGLALVFLVGGASARQAGNSARLSAVCGCPTATDQILLDQVDSYIHAYRRNINAVNYRYHQLVKAIRRRGGSKEEQIARVKAHTRAYLTDVDRAYHKDLTALRKAVKRWLTKATCAQTRDDIDAKVKEYRDELKDFYDADRRMPELAVQAIEDGCGCGGFGIVRDTLGGARLSAAAPGRCGRPPQLRLEAVHVDIDIPVIGPNPTSASASLTSSPAGVDVAFTATIYRHTSGYKTYTFPLGTPVTVHAVPGPNDTFGRWSGDSACGADESTNPNCRVQFRPFVGCNPGQVCADAAEDAHFNVTAAHVASNSRPLGLTLRIADLPT
jgi:hypothetical protein